MLDRHRNFMLVMTIIALSGVLVAQRVTADSSGASTTQADGSSTQIAALTRYVDAGGTHTCVVLDDASLKCFGSSSSGQIGSGGTASLGDAPAEMGNALLPVNLGTGRTVRAVSTGTAHTCALLDDGTVKCFGEGDGGRLGRGSTTDAGRSAASMGNALLPINLGTGRTAKAIATGAAHTCALRVLRDLARARAAAVCTLLAQRVPGVRTEVNIALSGEVQVVDPITSSQAGGHTPVRIAASDLQRRVLVVARPGQ